LDVVQNILVPSRKNLGPSWCPKLVTGLGKGEAAIAKHLYDHADHVSVR